MAQLIKEQKDKVAEKNRQRDREDSDGGVAGAGVERHGYGGMDTKNKAPKADKEGV